MATESTVKHLSLGGGGEGRARPGSSRFGGLIHAHANTPKHMREQLEMASC